MKLLLHTCCAPCAIYPADRARGDFEIITGFFYNPNIHPYSEFSRRQEESVRFFKSTAIELINAPYEIERYFRTVAGSEEAPERCQICWRLRIFQTAKFAKENFYDFFTTTLLGSPYQNHDVVKSICTEASERLGVDFYYQDFREGFRKAHTKAKESGIYCQNYCGCIYSKKERLTKNVKRKAQNQSLKFKIKI